MRGNQMKYLLIHKKTMIIIKNIFIVIALAFIFSFEVDGALAAIQLDDKLRPENLPTIEAEEAFNNNNPETAATNTLIMFVGSMISQVLLFTGALTIIFLIVSGVNYVFAFGKDERIEKAKRGIFWALVGLVTVLLSYAMAQGIIQIILQVDQSVK